LSSHFEETVEKILTVTVVNSTIEDPEGPTIEDPTTGGTVKAGNAKVTAQAVRKESKSASKLLLSKVGKTLMVPVAVRSCLPKPRAKPIILSWAMRLSIPILRDLRLNSVLFAPAPLLLPITTLAFVAVRKESKSASKLLLSKVGKTLMGRLSYIRHKNKQESSFSANGFVNGKV
jgi:hypothetical protein